MADREVAEQKETEARQIRHLYGIHENEGNVIITMEMPGVKKEDLTINVEGNELRARGQRDPAVESGTFLIRERRQGDFVQSFTLDDTIDQNRIDATLDKGVLSITLHLKEEVKPKLIEIKTK